MEERDDYEHLIVRSQIKPDLKRYVLMRGTLLGVLGGAIWLFSGILIPYETLVEWGLPLFILGLGLITVGLVPYRRLIKIENRPSELLVIENQQFSYAELGNKKFTIPFVCVKKMDFLERKRIYGIRFFLKDPLPAKLIVHDAQLDLEELIEKTRRRYGCDFFLPYFVDKTYDKIKEFKEQFPDRKPQTPPQIPA